MLCCIWLAQAPQGQQQRWPSVSGAIALDCHKPSAFRFRFLKMFRCKLNMRKATTAPQGHICAWTFWQQFGVLFFPGTCMDGVGDVPRRGILPLKAHHSTPSRPSLPDLPFIFHERTFTVLQTTK